VLSRRVGIRLGNQDVIVNATGGLRVKEPAADLAMALAIVSSVKDLPLDAETAAIGEVGLSGELRSVSFLDRRVNEAARIGFKRAIIPRSGTKNLVAPKGLQLLAASTIREAIRLAWGSRGAAKEEPEKES
jgi:DNA repair protein RadA/Sms